MVLTYSELQKYSYLKFISNFIHHEESGRQWSILDKMAEDWKSSGMHTDFMAYIFEHGATIKELPSFSEFLDSRYRDPGFMYGLLSGRDDYAAWCAEQGLDIDTMWAKYARGDFDG